MYAVLKHVARIRQKAASYPVSGVNNPLYSIGCACRINVV